MSKKSYDTGEELAAEVLSATVLQLKKKLNRKIKILEVGAGDGEMTAKQIRLMLDKHGISPNDFSYYCQDVRQLPQPQSHLRNIDTKHIHSLECSDFSSGDCDAQIEEHGPFDIILSKNVKVVGGIDPDLPFRGPDPEREELVGREIQGIHEKTRGALHEHGFMIDIYSKPEEEDYSPPPTDRWSSHPASREKQGFVASVYRKKQIKPREPNMHAVRAGEPRPRI